MIKLIFARSSNGIIGNKNALPWSLSDEMKIFKQKTLGHTVVMGRKTFESLPVGYCPLPGRKNVVITNNKNYKYPGVEFVTSPMEYFVKNSSDALKVQQTLEDETIWVIGGLDIYLLAMQFASEIHVTEILKDFAGDTLSPQIHTKKFYISEVGDVIRDSKTGIDFRVDIYKRH